MKKILCTAITALFLYTACNVSTNLDIQETVFAPDQSIMLSQEATGRGFKTGSKINLLGIGVSGYSDWETINIENLEDKNLILQGPPEVTNRFFQIDASGTKVSLGPYERTSFKVRYNLADTGDINTDLSLIYSVGGRKRNFKLNLVGNFSNIQLTEVKEGEIETVIADSGAAADFGYSPYDDVTKTFKIKNNSNSRVEIQNTVLDADAAAAGFFMPNGALSGFINPGESLEFNVTFRKQGMSEYKQGFIEITHSLSSQPYKAAICGGGSTIPLTIVRKEHGEDIPAAVPYKLTKNCVDFEYKEEVSQRDFAIKNTGIGILYFDSVKYEIPIGSESVFSIINRYENNEKIYPGGTAGISIKFTPQAGMWSETDIVIKDEKTNRTYTLSLTGSGFKQPSDLVDGGLALWLRADRIGTEHVKKVSAANRVLTMPDVSGKNLHAYKYGEDSPTYNAAGINGLPALTFSVEKEGMAVTTKNDTWIVKDAKGTTSFIVFKVSGGDDTRLRNQFAITSSNGDTRVFPHISTYSLYFDPIDGLYGNGKTEGKPLAYRKFNIENSFFSGPRSPAYSRQYSIPDGGIFAAAIRYDSLIQAPYENVHFFLNGDGARTGRTPIGFIDTRNTGDVSSNVRSYGYPVGDGEGNRRTHHIGPNENTNPCKKDYAWSLSAGHPYFSNRVNVQKPYNGTIRNIFMGNNAAGDGPFYGEIAEVIVFERALTDDEIKTVNNYIAVRYNTQPVNDLYTENPALP
ncbi:hypothetical protein H0R92_08560 [Treponema sp. OMZ 840]|uniref:hypothetical protein n=1 Tax=Treponema sp. OMZ 840 TaxID=244313 RepID=UPI003D89BD94